MDAVKLRQLLQPLIVNLNKAYPFSWAWCVIPLFLTLSTSVAAQTTIAIRRTPSEIVVGADSRVTLIRHTVDVLGQTNNTVTYPSICKIVVVGNNAFVVANYIGGEVGEVDVIGIARTALENNSSIIDAANSYGSIVQKPLRGSLERLRLLDLGSYRKTTLKKDGKTRDASEVVFVAVENGIPKLVARSFITTNDESSPVTLAPSYIDIPNKAFPKKLDMTLLAGRFEEIDKYKANTLFWRKNGNVKGIISLIKIMETVSEDVGGPIDILRITRKGAEWVQHKQECPDIPDPRPKPRTKRR